MQHAEEETRRSKGATCPRDRHQQLSLDAGSSTLRREDILFYFVALLSLFLSPKRLGSP